MEKDDIYVGYNHERYIHYRKEATGEYDIKKQKRNGKVIDIKMPIENKFKLDFEDVKELSLDDNGISVPTNESDFTLIHNYLFDFWGAIMGTEAITLYMHLKRYCYGRKDYCFPDMTTISAKMKKGRTTVVNNLEILEEHGFILRIWRMDKENNNSNASPLFKIRRYIPLLSEDLIEKLPECLKVEHEKYLANIQNVDIQKKTDVLEMFEKLKKNAEIFKSKTKKEKEKDALDVFADQKEYIASTLTEQQMEDWEFILGEIKYKVSEPSFETWFVNTVFILDRERNTLDVVCPNDFCKEWLSGRTKFIMSATGALFLPKNLYIKFSKHDDYIKKML